MPRYRDWRRNDKDRTSRSEQIGIAVATKLVLGMFQALRFFKWFIAALFLLMLSLLKSIAQWTFSHLLFPLYRQARAMQHWFTNHMGGHHHLIIRLVSHRWFLRIMAVTAVIALVGWNQFDRAIRADAYGEDMPVDLLVQAEEDVLIEEIQTATRTTLTTGTLLDDSLSAQFGAEGTDDLAPEPSTATITADSTALLKPEVSNLGAPATRTEPITYVIEAGDTIGSIAEKYGISVNTIMWANKLTARNVLRPGASLKILPTSGIGHKIVRGDTLQSVAKKYNVAINQIQEFNGLAAGAKLTLGQELVIPGARPLPPPAPPRRPIEPGILDQVIIPSGKGMMWPLASRRVTQYYNFRHHAIDIGAPTGSPVYAADDGIVEIARPIGWNGGYGKMLVINHGGGLSTLYAHNSQLLVKLGERVSKGQALAFSGNTGRSTGPHLHFEVWINRIRQNPLSYVR